MSLSRTRLNAYQLERPAFAAAERGLDRSFSQKTVLYLHPFHKRPLEAKAIPPVPFAYLREEEVALNATARRGHRLTLTTFSPLSLHSTVREPLGLLTDWSVELHRQE